MVSSAHLTALFTVACLLPTPEGPTATRAAAPAGSTVRVLTASIPAPAVTHLDLTSLDGTVDLRAADDPAAAQITVSVAIGPPAPTTFHQHPVSADLEKVTLDSPVTRNVARLRLGNASSGHLNAAWTITVPARFSVRISAHDGGVRVAGVEGGVEASLNAGSDGGRGALTVNVPRGALNLSVAYGDINATHASAQFGSADLRTTVGRANLYLLGHEIVTTAEPGPGHRIVIGGRGPDVLRLRATVGAVKLQIG